MTKKTLYAIVLSILSVLAPLPASAAGYGNDGGYATADDGYGLIAQSYYGQSGYGQSDYGESDYGSGQGGRQIIPPSMALQAALGYSPGSQGLGVSLLQGQRLVYSVKLKTGNQIHRVLVDAQTGQVIGQ